MMTIRYFLAIGLLFVGVHYAEGSINLEQVAKEHHEYMQNKKETLSSDKAEWLKRLLENIELNNQNGESIKEPITLNEAHKFFECSFFDKCCNFLQTKKYYVFGVAAVMAAYFIAKIAISEDEDQACDNNAADDESEVL